MSLNNDSGPPPDGVVPNSALTFLAPAQHPTMSGSDDNSGSGSRVNAGAESQTEILMPAGLKSLCDACSRLYPDQPNPLQVTTRLKYWLGGQDPLDYISMYWNPGNPDEDIPPHWYYVSFGLSDLHGDGRVHQAPDRVGATLGSPPPPSGLGLELTLRLRTEPGAPPPLWPAALLQALARYVFTTGNKFCAGDHITWHAPLDGGGGTARGSRVRHLLVTEDPQLGTVTTPYGSVNFLQIVGCTGRELRAAQRGSGLDVLKLMAEDPDCGGPWLVTVCTRARSARRVRCARAAPAAPAHLAGVTAALHWHRRPPTSCTKSDNSATSPPSPMAVSVEMQIKQTLQRGLTTISSERNTGHMSTDSFEMSSIERALPDVPELMQGSWRSESGESVEYLDGVQLILNAEGASLLPLAIDGRILHGRHFTWRNGPLAVTLVSERVSGALVTEAKPYAAQGGWLQIFIPKDLAADMSKQVAKLSYLGDADSESDGECERDRQQITLPLTLAWDKNNLNITVVHDHELI